MAFLYIAEYVDIQGDRQAAADPPLLEQKIAIAAGSATSAAFNPRTTLIRVHTDAVCSVIVGAVATVTASATNARMAANQTEYRAVSCNGLNGGTAIAVITNT